MIWLNSWGKKCHIDKLGYIRIVGNCHFPVINCNSILLKFLTGSVEEDRFDSILAHWPLLDPLATKGGPFSIWAEVAIRGSTVRTWNPTI